MGLTHTLACPCPTYYAAAIPASTLTPTAFAMADTPELLECRICGRRPATDRDRGRCGPCDAVARLQGMVHGSDLQVWMLHGMADGLHACFALWATPSPQPSTPRKPEPHLGGPGPASAGTRAKARAAGLHHAEATGTHRRLPWCARWPQPRPGQSKTACETANAFSELRRIWAVEFLIKATPRRAADQSPSVRGRCKKKLPLVCLDGSLEDNYADRRGGTMVCRVLATQTRHSATRVPHLPAKTLAGKKSQVLLPHPTLGRRIGEAAHPGTPSHEHDHRPQRYCCAHCGHFSPAKHTTHATSRWPPNSRPFPQPRCPWRPQSRSALGETAISRSALLQTYGGVGVATAAQSRADDARTLPQRPEPLEAPARSRQSTPHDADERANDAADAGAHRSASPAPSDDQILAAVAADHARARMRRRRYRGRGHRGGGRRGRGAPAPDPPQAEDDDDVAPPPAPSPPPLAGRAPRFHTHLDALCRPWTSKPNSATAACTLSSRPPVSSEGSCAMPSVLASSTLATHRRTHKRARAGSCSYWRRACSSTTDRA